VTDAIARMEGQAHWETDVLAGFALGTAFGYCAHHRDSLLVLSGMPHSGFRRLVPRSVTECRFR
jgi:hypothetical protein